MYIRSGLGLLRTAYDRLNILDKKHHKMLTSTLLALGVFASTLSASPVQQRQQRRQTSQAPAVAEATWDGSCFYPVPDDDFELDEYLGRWYQVAGTIAPFTAGCKCVFAEYSLNVSSFSN